MGEDSWEAEEVSGGILQFRVGEIVGADRLGEIGDEVEDVTEVLFSSNDVVQCSIFDPFLFYID